jgi:hypothetical protein
VFTPLFDGETGLNRVIRTFYPTSGQNPTKFGTFLNFLPEALSARYIITSLLGKSPGLPEELVGALRDAIFAFFRALTLSITQIK